MTSLDSVSKSNSNKAHVPIRTPKRSFHLYLARVMADPLQKGGQLQKGPTIWDH